MAKKKYKNIPEIAKRILPTSIEFSMNMITQPNFLRKTFIVRNLPESIKQENNRVLMDLMQMPNTTVSMRVADMNGSQVKSLTDKQINNSHSGQFKRKATDQLEAEGELADLKDFYIQCYRDTANGSSMKSTNIFIETYGKTEEELEKAVNRVNIKCQSYGVSIEECLLRQKEGFVGVSPIGTDTRGRLLANNIPSTTFGQLFPWSASSLNDPRGMILGKTIDNGLISLDIWDRTRTRTNSNIVIIGDSGQGKSQLVKKIISQQYPRNTVIFTIDADGEYVDICNGMGGTNVNCARGDFVINPLEVRYFRNTNEDLEFFDKSVASFGADKTPFYQHLGWLGDFYKIIIPALSDNTNINAALMLNALKIFTQDLYNKMGINEDTNFSELMPKDYPIFTDLYNYIEDVYNNYDKGKYEFYKIIEKSLIGNLLLCLTDVYKGSLSPLFNKHTNIINARFTNLNILELKTGSEDNLQAVLFNYLTYIWGRIIRKTDNIMLIIDELHLFLDVNNPTVAKYLSSFVRRSRKYEASLVTATQKLRDCLDDKIIGYTSVIFDIPTYKFLFYPGDIELDLMRKKLHLTDGERSIINTSNQGNCLLKVANDKYQLLIGLLPFEKVLFGEGGGR